MTPCIRWWGSFRRDGYGQTGIDLWEGKQIAAHRMAWRECFGEIPAGLWVLHDCDNKACVNPEHLYLGTRTDNTRDAMARKRLRPGCCPGARNGNAKMTVAKVRAIRRRYEAGESPSALGRRYGIARTHVHRIVKRANWERA